MCVLYTVSDGADFFRPLIEVNVLFAEALLYRTLIPLPFSGDQFHMVESLPNCSRPRKDTSQV